MCHREPGVNGWPAGGLGDDQTGGGSAVAGDEPIDGNAEGTPGMVVDGVPGVIPGVTGAGTVVVPGVKLVVPGAARFVGRPVLGSIGDVVPNGCGVTNGDGVPVGDCDGTVDGADVGGCVSGVVTPVWASAGPAASATMTRARTVRDIEELL